MQKKSLIFKKNNEYNNDKSYINYNNNHLNHNDQYNDDKNISDNDNKKNKNIVSKTENAKRNPIDGPPCPSTQISSPYLNTLLLSLQQNSYF